MRSDKFSAHARNEASGTTLGGGVALVRIMQPVSTPNPSARQWILAGIVVAGGVFWQYFSLWLVDRLVTIFPSVSDLLMDRFPVITFGLWGEVLFFGLILVFAIPHFRLYWQDTPRILITLGLFYFVRGWVQLFFPIGAPAGAIDPSQRLNIWGYANHAYFPGGHIGILTILVLNQRVRSLRPWMWIGVAAFGIGTMLAKNHYVADSLVGMVLAYAITVWVWRRTNEKRPDDRRGKGKPEMSHA